MDEFHNENPQRRDPRCWIILQLCTYNENRFIAGDTGVRGSCAMLRYSLEPLRCGDEDYARQKFHLGISSPRVSARVICTTRRNLVHHRSARKRRSRRVSTLKARFFLRGVRLPLKGWLYRVFQLVNGTERRSVSSVCDGFE